MSKEEYFASKQITLTIPQGVVELVPMKDALKAVKMAKDKNKETVDADPPMRVESEPLAIIQKMM